MIYHIISSFLRKEEINLSEQKMLIQQLQSSGSYVQLIPKVDAYTKSDTLTNSTSQMFGINNGTPEQVLQYLGKYNQYWWKREINDSWTQNRTSKTGAIVSGLNVPSSSGHGFSWSTEVTYSGLVAEDASANLVGYTDTVIFRDDFSNDSYFAQNYILGKYICFATGGKGPIYYIPLNATLSYEGSLKNTAFISSSYEYITYIKQPRTFDTYIQSNNRNAYPDAGTQGSYYYTFLGIPLSNAVLLAKTEEYL